MSSRDKKSLLNDGKKSQLNEPVTGDGSSVNQTLTEKIEKVTGSTDTDTDTDIDTQPIIYVPADKTITICANVSVKAEEVHYWDIVLTCSGANVLTPCHLYQDIEVPDLDFGDFVQNKKIQASDAVLVIANSVRSIDTFIVPWVMHAFSWGIPVFTDTPLEDHAKEYRFKANSLFKPCKWYPLGRSGLELKIRKIEQSKVDKKQSD